VTSAESHNRGIIRFNGAAALPLENEFSTRGLSTAAVKACPPGFMDAVALRAPSPAVRRGLRLTLVPKAWHFSEELMMLRSRTQVMSASAKPRLAGRQPSVRGRGAPGEDRARRVSVGQAAKQGGLPAVPTSFGETAVPGGQDARISSVRVRSADAEDAEQIAALHADSWRRHYRGAYADSFLDGDVVADRRLVWSSRLAVPVNSETVLAERDGRLIGFIHVVFDADPRWGSLVDNLHVVHDQRRTGIGTHLLHRGARSVSRQASGNGMYLWVLQQNTAAQQFYYSRGATRVQTAPVPPPGGDPARLNGTPRGLRMAWPNVARLLQPRRFTTGDDVLPPSDQ
jgi:GNAT superfamily N-acetyltransferase